VTWLVEELVVQAAARERAEALRKAREALPPPRLEDVLAALRGGARFVDARGPSTARYFMDGDVIRRDTVDDIRERATPRLEDVSHDELRRAIKAAPHAFRSPWQR
jgi:hypothetical protein